MLLESEPVIKDPECSMWSNFISKLEAPRVYSSENPKVTMLKLAYLCVLTVDRPQVTHSLEKP